MLITIMLSVTVVINDFILTVRREKKSMGQAITIQPLHSLKVLQLSSNVNCHPILL